MLFSAEVPENLAESAIVIVDMTPEAFNDGEGTDDGAFLRLDLYPLFNPRTPTRHYGYWDIPLRHLRPGRNRIRLDLPRLSVVNSEFHLEAPTFETGFFECGYLILHMSLWSPEATGLSMRHLSTHKTLLTDADGDVPLRYVGAPTTNACNLECIVCPRNVWEDINDMHAPRDILDAILVEADDISQIYFTSLGEPFLNKRMYKDLADTRAAISPNARIGIVSNGTVLNERNTDALLATGVDHIFFSMDGASREVAEATRPGLDFDKTMSQIRHVIEKAKTAALDLHVSLAFVIQDINWHEVPDFVRLGADIGADSVSFNWFYDMSSGLYCILDTPDVREVFAEAARIGSERGTPVSLPNFGKVETRPCDYMQQTLVWSDGNVYPCCNTLPAYASGRESISFGNVRERPLREIWNSTGYQDFRKRVLAKDWPEICANCDMRKLHQS